MADDGHYTSELDPDTGKFRQVKKGGDPNKKGYVDPSEGRSTGLAAAAKAAAERRKKKKEMDSIGGSKQ